MTGVTFSPPPAREASRTVHPRKEAVVIFLAFLVVFTLDVAFTLYGRRATGIAQHPYHNIYGGAPGSYTASRMTGSPDREVLSWSRGTR